MRAPFLSMCLALVAAPTVARADAQSTQKTGRFGDRAANVVALDSIAGFFRETVVTDAGEQGALVAGTHVGPSAFGDTARVGFHRFVVPAISLGVAAHVSASQSRDRFPDGGKSWGVAPRVGFVFGATEQFAFWLRVGAQYARHGYADDVTAWDAGVGGELLFVWTPYAHFGLTLGPMAEIGVAGKLENPSAESTNVRRRTFGLTLGWLFDL